MISSEISSEIRHREDAGWAARVLSGSCPWEPWREGWEYGCFVAGSRCTPVPVRSGTILHSSSFCIIFVRFRASFGASTERRDLDRWPAFACYGHEILPIGAQYFVKTLGEWREAHRSEDGRKKRRWSAPSRPGPRSGPRKPPKGM